LVVVPFVGPVEWSINEPVASYYGARLSRGASDNVPVESMDREAVGVEDGYTTKKKDKNTHFIRRDWHYGSSYPGKKETTMFQECTGHLGAFTSY